MKISKDLKGLICQQLNSMLEGKAETISKAISITKESRDNDTKSSAGDKYETGRAMMQIELEKSEVQLSKTRGLQKELSNINLRKEYKQVEFGSLTETDQGCYFIAIGIGKVELDEHDYYCISLASPIGSLLRGKSIGDTVSFQGREFLIKDIV